MINFRDAHYPNAVLLFATYFYGGYGVSYRDLKEILEEPGTIRAASACALNFSCAGVL